MHFFSLIKNLSKKSNFSKSKFSAKSVHAMPNFRLEETLL